MNWVREFGAREGHLPPVRNIDDQAPERMRQELVDAVYHCRVSLIRLSLNVGPIKGCQVKKHFPLPERPKYFFGIQPLAILPTFSAAA